MAIVEGVIASEPGGAKSSGSGWCLVVSLAPWRHPDGHIEQRELRVEQMVGSSARLDRAMERLSKGDAVKVTTARVKPPRPGFPWWECSRATRIARTSKTPGLAAAQRERERPVVVRDAVVGRLVLDRDLRALVGRRTLAGRRYELAIDQPSEDGHAERVIASRPRVLAFERGYPRIVAAITTWMLRLYNDNWRGERARLSRRALSGRLRLTSVQVGAGDRTTMYFEVGALFEGHVVEVRLGPRANIREMMLAG